MKIQDMQTMLTDGKISTIEYFEREYIFTSCMT